MQRNKNFFEGQKIYVGIDVHARQWHVFASPWPGIGMKAFSMPPSAKGLKTYLEKQFPGGTFLSAYESGFCGFSSHRQLTEEGIENIVFNAADLKKSQKEELRKTDALDCRAIWENLCKGDIRPIYVPTPQQEEDRELIRGRETAVKDLRRCRQRVKMFLHKLGIDVPDEFKGKGSSWSNSFVSWLGVLADSLNGGNSIKLRSQLVLMAQLKTQIMAYNKEIHLVMDKRHAEMYSLLTSVPGIGKLLAAKLCLELMDFNRFQDARKLAAYVGLVPDCRASDKKVVVLGNTIRRNPILRVALIEAAWVGIRKDPALTADFHKHRAAGQHANLAIIATARKLVNRIFYVWRTKKKYELSKE